MLRHHGYGAILGLLVALCSHGKYVDPYRKFGLPSEVIASFRQCEVLGAISKHYLHVGASGAPKHRVNEFVPKASHGSCCSSNLPQTYQEHAKQVRREGHGTENGNKTGMSPPVPSQVIRRAHLRGYVLICFYLLQQ